MRHIAYLIVKSILSDLSEQEKKELSQWRSSSRHNENLYKKYSGKDFLQDMASLYTPGEETELYRQLQKKMHPARKRKIAWYKWTGAIAACLLLSVILYQVYTNYKQEQNVIVLADLKPGTQQATLYTYSGDEETVMPKQTEKVIINYPDNNKSLNNENNEPQGIIQQPAVRVKDIKRIIVPRGGEYNVVLKDQSNIYLNSESDIQFAPEYGVDKREMAFKGEAYFNVAKMENQQPFIIHTEFGTVEVKGTSFNLRCYENEKILQIALENGCVHFTPQHNKGTYVLNPGQLLTYHAEEQEITTEDTDISIYTSWKNGIYSFRQTPLSAIMNDLSRWYNIPISFAKKELENITFTGEVKRYDNFIDIAGMFELTKMIRFKANRNGIIIEEQK